MRILAIDPGTRASGVVLYDSDTDRVLAAHKCYPNEDLRGYLIEASPDVVACEWIEHYGPNIHAGADVYHTCRWIGRFEEVAAHAGLPFETVTRRQVKLNLCGSMRAKDPDVRLAIVDRYGGAKVARGLKKTPGPLYGVSSHAWSALGVVLTYLDELPEDPDCPTCEGSGEVIVSISTIGGEVAVPKECPNCRGQRS